jgi:hypothetical protein
VASRGFAAGSSRCRARFHREARWARRPRDRRPKGPSDARESGARRRTSKGLSGVMKPRHPSNHGAG